MDPRYQHHPRHRRTHAPTLRTTPKNPRHPRDLADSLYLIAPIDSTNDQNKHQRKNLKLLYLHFYTKTFSKFGA